MAKLASGVFASGVMRQATAQGGFAMLLQRGDDTAGSVLLSMLEKGQSAGVYERLLTRNGVYQWTRIGPQTIENIQEITEYLDRRRKADPDLWLVELDIPDPARFIAQLDDLG